MTSIKIQNKMAEYFNYSSNKHLIELRPWVTSFKIRSSLAHYFVEILITTTNFKKK